MATYNMGQWKQCPQRKVKQKLSTITRTIDFAIQPISSGFAAAWAAGDIIELIGIRAGQIVLGVTVDIKKKLVGGRFEVGDGTHRGRWGSYNMGTEGVIDPHSGVVEGNDQYFFPHTYASSDTIDIRIQSATPTSGRAQISVHIIEDDRK